MNSGTSVDVTNYRNYRVFLRDFVAEKKFRTPNWSYAILARQLQVKSPSTLIMILNGQRNPSTQLVSKLAKYFAFNEQENMHWSDIVKITKLTDKHGSDHTLMGLTTQPPRLGMKILAENSFQIRSFWYYCAIRELVRLADFKEDPCWIKSKLNLSLPTKKITQVLYTLLGFKLLKRNSLGKLIYTDQHVVSKEDISDSTLKTYHDSMLKRACEAQFNTELWEREISGGSVAISTKNLPLAKKMIRRFQRELCEALEQDNADAVYQLEVAFFPLTRSKGPNYETH